MNNPIQPPRSWISRFDEASAEVVAPLGILGVIFFGMWGCGVISDEAAERENTQLVANFRQQGFALSEEQAYDVRREERLTVNVGSCKVTILVDDSGDNYRPYVPLNGDIKRYVTKKSLETLPKMRDCSG